MGNALPIKDWHLLVAAALGLVVAGCLPAPGADNAFYVLIPYAAAMVLCIMGICARFDFTFRRPSPEGLAESERMDRVRRRSLSGSIAAAVCAIAETLHLLFIGVGNGFGYSTQSAQPAWSGIMYGIVYVLVAILASYCMLRASRKCTI